MTQLTPSICSRAFVLPFQSLAPPRAPLSGSRRWNPFPCRWPPQWDNRQRQTFGNPSFKGKELDYCRAALTPLRRLQHLGYLCAGMDAGQFDFINDKKHSKPMKGERWRALVKWPGWEGLGRGGISKKIIQKEGRFRHCPCTYSTDTIQCRILLLQSLVSLCGLKSTLATKAQVLQDSKQREPSYKGSIDMNLSISLHCLQVSCFGIWPDVFTSLETITKFVAERGLIWCSGLEVG